MLAGGTMYRKENLNALRVLIVEDEYFLATDLAELLKAHGVDVIGPVPDNATALALLMQKQPDVAVLDVGLQRQRVYVVADALSVRNIPFLFVTGFGEDVIAERFRKVQR